MTVPGDPRCKPGIKAKAGRVKLPNKFFGGFNPYADRIRGDWYKSGGRDPHSGAHPRPDPFGGKTDTLPGGFQKGPLLPMPCPV